MKRMKYDFNEHDDLIDLNDNVDDKLLCPNWWYPEIDFDYKFIYSDGKLYTNENNNAFTHTELMNIIDQSIDDDVVRYKTDTMCWSDAMKTPIEIKEDDLCAGYVYQNMAFIDAVRSNVSNKLINLLKERVDKIYFYKKPFLTRLSNLIIKRLRKNVNRHGDNYECNKQVK